jgi:hypothetical protein
MGFGCDCCGPSDRHRRQGLDPSIGLMQFDWVQTIDRPPFELASHGGSLIREGAACEEFTPLSLTARATPQQRWSC